MIGPPIGSWPAVTGLERAASLRLRLYEVYDSDVKLTAELKRTHLIWSKRLGPRLSRSDQYLPDLRETGQAPLDQALDDQTIADYMEAVKALARDVGLDRILRVGTPSPLASEYLPSGTTQVHRYLRQLDRALMPQDASTHIGRVLGLSGGRPTFVNLASFGISTSAADTSIQGSESHWDPRAETRGQARIRLMNETTLARDAIEAQLERISCEGGYEFPDTSTKRGDIYRLDRDVQWVWWRIRHRWTYEQIVRRWERLHPGDIRLQRQRRNDPATEERDPDVDASESDHPVDAWESDHPVDAWESAHPVDAGELVAAIQAIRQVRKAVTTFAGRAQVQIGTAPGPRAGEAKR